MRVEISNSKVFAWRFEFKNNESSNVEGPNLRVTKYEIKIEKIDLYYRSNRRFGKIASSADRMDEQLQSCQFFQPNFGFPNLKDSRNLLIFQFRQVQTFPISETPKTFQLVNAKNSDWKITENSNSGNSKNLQFEKLQKFLVRENPKIFNLKHCKNF